MGHIFELLGMRFLTGEAGLPQTFEASYSLWLVIVSYGFALFGSYAGLSVSQQVAAAQRNWIKALWIAVGATAMGGGVWSMHFIAMLAWKLPIEVSYDIVLTSLSVVPSIGASAIALFILSKARIKLSRLIAGGVLVGGGIGGMHYIGMAAMRADAAMAYDPTLFLLSIVVAVILACGALSVKYHLEHSRIKFVTRCPNAVGAAFMGLAISCMHYVAMAGVVIFPGSHGAIQGSVIGGGSITVIVNVFILLVITLVLMASVARRYLTRTSLLSAIFDNSREGHLIFDGGGIITLISPAVERIFGYTANEVVGKDVSLLLASTMRDLTGNENLSGLGRLMDQNREVVALKKGGGEFPLEITVSDISIGNEALYSATVRDITARRAAERATRHAHDELAAALEQQKELNELQTQFVSTASHEFRTPLAIIDSTAQRIVRRSDRMSPEELVERVGKIRNAVKRMTGLIDCTLDASRFEAGKLRLSPGEVDLKDVLAQICRRQREISTGHEITLDVERLPDRIISDARLIDQIFTNLMSNAAKYSRDEPVIRVEGWTDGDDVMIRIVDNGVGIPADEIPHLFERFFRATTSMGIPGTGIGLNLVKQMVEIHAGSVSVESKEGEGTKFTVRLPIKADFKEISVTSDRATPVIAA